MSIMLSIFPKITKKDLTEELSRLDNIIMWDSHPIIIKSAREKRNWVLDFMRDEFTKRGLPKRSRLPSLSEMESI